MAEEKIVSAAGDDGNVKHWEEQDAILMKHREEAYTIGGEEQLKRLAKQGKKTMR